MARKEKKLNKSQYLLCILLLLLLVERLVLFVQLGPDYLSYSDDEAYVKAGLYFAETGIISMWGPYPSAMIMPAMPILIGLFSILFGQGATLLVAVKILWILMGVTTAYVAYKTVSLFCPSWAAFLAALHFLIPNLAWMNHVLLTETPYMLFLSLTIYYTFQMEKQDHRKAFVFYLLSFMVGLMFRANMLIVPIFTAVYLLAKKKNPLLLLRRGLILLCVLLVFVIPWSIRNYIQFHAVIPITYGAGNPLLLGTYEGEGYPEDEELDYEKNVYSVIQERYAAWFRDEPAAWETDDQNRYYVEHFDPQGEVKELKCAQFLSLQTDAVKAKYRIHEWFQRDPESFLKSYLLIKPRWMLNWSWCWEEAFHVPYSVLHRISQLNALFCVLTVVLAVILKKHRAPVLFLSLSYVFSIYLYSTSFVSDRYASTLMIFRYVLVGFGFVLFKELICRFRRKT